MVASRSYPPSPWRLRASGHCSFWRLPATAFHLPLPRGVRPFTAARSVWLASGFVNYGPAGDLSYRELFLAVLVRAEETLAVHVTSIWVDSDVSLQGGRALWGVPKQLAQFQVATTPPAYECFSSEGMLARSSFRTRWRWPFRSKARALVVQDNGGTLQYTPIEASARVAIGTAQWQFPRSSPLHILAARKPVLSMEIRDGDVRFGA